MRSWKFPCFVVALGLMLVRAGSASGERAIPATPPAADAIVQAVQARYDATTDLSGDVIQETNVVRLNKTIMARGTVAFKKPGKMRWELANGDREVIVSDGKTLWMYRPEDQQVLRMPFDSAFRSSTPISFLTGVGKIAENFRVAFEGAEDGRLRLRLEPKRQEADVGVLWLLVDATSFDIVGAEVQDPLGNRSKLTFQNVRRNQGLSDTLFEFAVPAGVDVLEAPRE